MAGEGGGTIGDAGAGGVGGGGCDWTRAACMDKTCEAVCPTNDSGTCKSQCGGIVTCVMKSSEMCGTEDDPMCVLRGKGTGTPNTCTTVWEAAGAQTKTGPSGFAVTFFECACGIDVLP
jgi:hypothetical protein